MARKILFPLCFVLALALTSCAPAGQTAAQDDGTTHLVATTYPVYLFTAELVKGVEDITVDLMIDQPISCLHDYTLSVKDMKTLERADLIILNGAGLEETMEDALDTVSDTPQIDCAQGIALLESSHDHDHGHDHDDHDHEDTDHDEPSDHDHESDPHIWLDPNRVEQMLDNLAAGLRRFDPTHAALYETNCRLAQEQLKTAYPQMQAALQNLSCRELITFHDGFAYFAEAFDLEIVRAIEEEAGSEASAKSLAEISTLVQTHNIPVVFTETNGSTAGAEAIARETGCGLSTLSTGLGGGDYFDTLRQNIDAVKEALS